MLLYANFMNIDQQKKHFEVFYTSTKDSKKVTSIILYIRVIAISQLSNRICI